MCMGVVTYLKILYGPTSSVMYCNCMDENVYGSCDLPKDFVWPN